MAPLGRHGVWCNYVCLLQGLFGWVDIVININVNANINSNINSNIINNIININISMPLT